jgi:hypothetical protein
LKVPCVEETMSGKEPTDIIGYPYRVTEDGQEVMKLAPPTWFNGFKSTNRDDDIISQSWLKEVETLLGDVPEDRKPQRVLIMDEYNRVPPDTFGPMMNRVLTQTHQGEKMIHRTLIILTGNQNTTADDNYNINILDPAQKDRVREVTVSPTLEEWVSVVKGDIHEGVLNYVRANLEHVNAFSQKGFLSLRTMTKLGRRLRNLPDDTIRDRGQTIINMFVPQGAGINIFQFVLETTGNINAMNIITMYEKISKDVRKLAAQKEIPQLTVLAEKVIPALVEYGKSILHDPEWNEKTKKATSNVLNFLLDAPAPIVVKILKDAGEVVMDKDKPIVTKLLTQVSSPSNKKIWDIINNG